MAKHQFDESEIWHGEFAGQGRRSIFDAMFHVKWAFAAIGFVIGLLTGVGIH